MEYIPIINISSCVRFIFKRFNIIGKEIPLSISNNKTTIPISVPRILKVFVAPVPLLPNSLTSIPFISFPNQTDRGIEPMRYDAILSNFFVKL